MTTVGYGDVTPAEWYTQLIVISEMFLSVTYTVVIFSQGLSHFNTPLILEPDPEVPEQLPLSALIAPKKASVTER